MKPYLSVVIPAYNESANFDRGALDEVWDYLKKQKYSWEVLVVNDGSTDDTLSKIQGYAKTHKGFKALDIPHGGKVAAVTAGVKAAEGEYVLFTDFDQSTPIDQVEKVINAFEKGADVVIGQRTGEKGWSFLQKLRSKIFNILVQLIALPGIKDSQCGFKAFRNELGKKLFDNLQVTQKTQKGGYMGAFDVELLFLARKMKQKIVAITVPWKFYESGRLGSIEPLKMLRDVILVRINNLSSWKTHLPMVFLLLLLTIPAWQDTLSKGYFPMHDDLQPTRVLVMDKCFRDGQFPCRWSEDLGYGYGYPLFNFYPPMPYYLGEAFHKLGFTFLDSVKGIILAEFLVAALTMYLLAQAFWGKWGGMFSALMYTYAPYHASDIYVRGAINEAWALSWFPLAFWAGYKLIITNQWRYVPVFALSLGLLMLSHNPIFMIFAPGLAVWCLYWWLTKRSFKVFPKLVVTGLWGLGLSAFFTLPVLFEQKYAHVETLVSGYFNYLAHFATFNQLFFDRSWGFGASELGPIDGMSFQVGILHWVLALLSLEVALLWWSRRRAVSIMIVIMFLMTLGYTFMAHEKSSFIWKVVHQLEFLQFPWRFLTLSIFGTSFLAGSVIVLLQQLKWKWFVVLVGTALVTGTIFFYKDYFFWRDHFPNVKDADKFSGKEWKLQMTSGIFDYLPIYAPFPPADPPQGDGQIIKGNGPETKTLIKNSKLQKYEVTLTEPGVFQINTYYFPGWTYEVNGKAVTIDPQKDLDKVLGRPLFSLPAGQHTIEAKFGETPIRVFGNTWSVVAWTGLFVALLMAAKKRWL